jgi:hypothetical protein
MIEEDIATPIGWNETTKATTPEHKFTRSHCNFTTLSYTMLSAVVIDDNLNIKCAVLLSSQQYVGDLPSENKNWD